MPRPSRRKSGLLALAAASLTLLVFSSVLAIGVLRTVRELSEAGPYLAVRFSIFLTLAILAGQGLGRAIGSLAPLTERTPDPGDLERRVADLEARLRDA